VKPLSEGRNKDAKVI